MKTVTSLCLAAVCGSMLLAASASAAPQAKSYQVTGPVLEVTDTSITVENKAGEKWQIARDAGTKITGDIKVGSKVTIQYRMTATDVEVKADKAEKAAPVAKPEAAEKAKKK